MTETFELMAPNWRINVSLVAICSLTRYISYKSPCCTNVGARFYEKKKPQTHLVATRKNVVYSVNWSVNEFSLSSMRRKV